MFLLVDLIGVLCKQLNLEIINKTKIKFFSFCRLLKHFSLFFFAIRVFYFLFEIKTQSKQRGEEEEESPHSY
jgi:hypothetical protein